MASGIISCGREKRMSRIGRGKKEMGGGEGQVMRGGWRKERPGGFASSRSVSWWAWAPAPSVSPA